MRSVLPTRASLSIFASGSRSVLAPVAPSFYFSPTPTTTAAATTATTAAKGFALHAAASIHSAFWAASLALPFDVLLARYSVATSAERARLGAVGIASLTLAKEGPGVLVRGWFPMFGRLAPLYVAGSSLFEQIRCVAGAEYYA